MRISDFAERLGSTAHAIRFSECVGLLPGARRSRNGYREYSEADLEPLRLLIGCAITTCLSARRGGAVRSPLETVQR